MTSQDEAVRRTLSALRSEADAGAEHPGIETLEAYVEGRLSPEARAEVDRVAAVSRAVAEDLADLRAVHQALAPGESRRDSVAAARVEGRRDIQWGLIAAIGAVAATVVIGVWVSRPVPSAPVSAPQQAASQLTADEQARVSAALTRGHVALPDRIAALIRPQGTLLGATGSTAKFSPLNPVGTGVRSVRPTFVWSDAGADAYTVAVFDDNFTELARSPRLARTSWTPDADLARGGTYVWQVTAHHGSRSETEPKPPAPESRFTVLSADTLSRVEAFESRLTGEPIALGVLLAEAGLIDEARVALSRAAKAADTGDVAKRLLASLDQPAP